MSGIVILVAVVVFVWSAGMFERNRIYAWREVYGIHRIQINGPAGAVDGITWLADHGHELRMHHIQGRHEQWHQSWWWPLLVIWAPHGEPGTIGWTHKQLQFLVFLALWPLWIRTDFRLMTEAADAVLAMRWRTDVVTEADFDDFEDPDHPIWSREWRWLHEQSLAEYDATNPEEDDVA